MVFGQEISAVQFENLERRSKIFPGNLMVFGQEISAVQLENFENFPASHRPASRLDPAKQAQQRPRPSPSALDSRPRGSTSLRLVDPPVKG